MATRALANTTSITALSNDVIRGRLIEREKSLIAKSQDMVLAVQSQGGYGTSTYKNIITLAKGRLIALQAGLMPVRLGGTFVQLRQLLNTGQYVPPAIVAKAQEAKERFPQAQQRVYGWEENATTAIRRRRDPVLTMFTGGSEFFLGFWLEIEVPDDSTPEFFGMTAPLLPKPGPGRPRKIR